MAAGDADCDIDDAEVNGTASDGVEVPTAQEAAQRFGSVISDGVRRSTRERRQSGDSGIYAYRMSIKKAIVKHGDVAKDAVRKELGQMINKEVFEFIHPTCLSKERRRSVIRSSLFLKEKLNPEGVFTKLKARLVAGGDQQDKSLYEDISSPTVSLESIMMVIAIAAAEKRNFATCDITGAYLEARMPDDEEVLMSLDPTTTSVVVELCSDAERCVDANGVLVVRLKRALYGCVQSSKLWYDKLCEVLKHIGFTANNYDQCVFNKTVAGEQITVCFHVDDLLITSRSNNLIAELRKELQANFTEITFACGDTHSYLSMNLNLSDEYVSVDMSGYVSKCLEDRERLIGANSPGSDSLFYVPEESPTLDAAQKEKFHSDVAKLLYLSKRDRKDILVAVSHLCSRVACPTKDDLAKLERVFGYLSRTRKLCTKFKRGVPVDMTAYIDASFGVHADGESRTGVILMMSGAAVGAWSSKQKLVTKSSTEAELVGLSDGSSAVLWAREWLLDQGYRLPPTVIYQDNQGVLSLLRKGRHMKQRTRHLNVRFFFIKDVSQREIWS